MEGIANFRIELFLFNEDCAFEGDLTFGKSMSNPWK